MDPTSTNVFCFPGLSLPAPAPSSSPSASSPLNPSPPPASTATAPPTSSLPSTPDTLRKRGHLALLHTHGEFRKCYPLLACRRQKTEPRAYGPGSKLLIRSM